MTTWPAHLCRYEVDGYEETPQPIVQRTEMERGLAKQRRVATRPVVTVSLTLRFDSPADVAAFEAWFYGPCAAGANWFDWVHPRTGQTVSARIVGGDIGALRTRVGTFARTERSLRLEYLRAAS